MPSSPRSILASLGALACVALLLAACAGLGSTSAGGPTNEKITIWHNWQGAALTAKQQIFAAYTKAHPNVSIVLVQKSDIATQAPAAIKAGVGPDIVAGVDNQLGALVNADVLQPTDQWITPHFLETTYSPAAASALEFNGHTWGVPESVAAVTLIYNKALTSADRLPQTAGGIVDFNQAYALDHPGNYGIVWDPTNAYYDTAFFYGYGGYFAHADGSVGLTTPGSLQAGNLIASLRSTLPAQLGNGAAGQLFSQGKAAAILDGPWAYNDYANTAKLNLGFALLPMTGGTHATPFVDVQSLWISKTAADPALAADLLTFYTNKQNQTALAQQDHEIPANLQASQDSVVTGNAAIGGFAAQIPNGVALPNTPYMDKIWVHINAALTSIWNGSATPQAALQQAQQASLQDIAAIKK